MEKVKQTARHLATTKQTAAARQSRPPQQVPQRVETQVAMPVVMMMVMLRLTVATVSVKSPAGGLCGPIRLLCSCVLTFLCNYRAMATPQMKKTMSPSLRTC